MPYATAAKSTVQSCS